jgi:hypothetical protein
MQCVVQEQWDRVGNNAGGRLLIADSRAFALTLPAGAALLSDENLAKFVSKTHMKPTVPRHARAPLTWIIVPAFFGQHWVCTHDAVCNLVSMWASQTQFADVPYGGIRCSKLAGDSIQKHCPHAGRGCIAYAFLRRALLRLFRAQQ